MLTVSEYRDLPALDGLRDVWRELWWKTPRASFFQSLEWFERHCRQAPRVVRPRVLVVAVAGRPVGLVPWVETKARSPIGRIRVVRDPLAEQGFFGGPLGTEPKLTLQTALRHARTDRTSDLLELRHVERGRVADEEAVHSTQPARPSGATEESRAVVDCRGDWVTYLRSRPQATRAEYRRAEQMLAERGRLEYVRYRPEGTFLDDDNPDWGLFNEAEGAQRGFDAKSERRRSLREMHETAATIAGVDLNLLRLDGKPIAWAYNYRCDGRVEMQRRGARSVFASEASCVLLGRMIHDGFRRGDEWYLFDRQTSRAAGGWQTGRMTSRRRIHYSRRGPRTQLVRWLGGFSC